MFLLLERWGEVDVRRGEGGHQLTPDEPDDSGTRQQLPLLTRELNLTV